MPERNKKDRELSDDKLESEEAQDEVQDLEEATGIGAVLGGTLRKKKDEENMHEEDGVAEEVRQQREVKEQ